MYALTNIKFNDEFIEAGTEVDESHFGEHAEGLIEVGALGKYPKGVGTDSVAADALAARDARIRELESRLADLGEPQNPDPSLDPSETPDEVYDPNAYNAEQVLEYADAHPDELEAMLAAERSGKSRVTVISGLEERIAAG
jgi:hypothetical protein